MFQISQTLQKYIFQVTKYLVPLQCLSCYYASFVIAERCLVKELKESDLDISLALDERVGSFPNYVLNVSWPPTNCKWNTPSATLTVFLSVYQVWMRYLNILSPELQQMGIVVIECLRLLVL